MVQCWTSVQTVWLQLQQSSLAMLTRSQHLHLVKVWLIKLPHLFWVWVLTVYSDLTICYYREVTHWSSPVAYVIHCQAFTPFLKKLFICLKISVASPIHASEIMSWWSQDLGFFKQNSMIFICQGMFSQYQLLQLTQMAMLSACQYIWPQYI